MSTTNDGKMISVTEAARRAGRHRNTILNWIYNGDVEFSKKNGRAYEVDEASLAARIQRLGGRFLRRHE